MSYVERLIPCVSGDHRHGLRMDPSPALVALAVRRAGPMQEIERAMTASSGRPVMLMGTHRPFEDQFPAEPWHRVGGRAATGMQRNQVYRQYGELLGRELRLLGFSVLHLRAEDVPEADDETIGEALAALWSGLRTEGIALCLELPEANGRVGWTRVRYALVSGLPFVSIPYSRADRGTWQALIETERFAGVACVTGLGASGLAGKALVDAAAELLDAGWHALVLDDLDQRASAALIEALSTRTPKNGEAQADALGRLSKRRAMLEAVEERGLGAVALDRDADYLMKRRLLSHKTGIEDPYAFSERPARWGSIVRLHYRLHVDGELRDESTGEGLRVLLGKGQIIAGLEEALIGRRKGERFVVEVPPEKGYGPVDAANIVRIPRGGILLQAGERLEPGARAVIPRGGGKVVHGRIVEVGEDEVLVDGNHELAGKTLHFELSVLDVI